MSLAKVLSGAACLASLFSVAQAQDEYHSTEKDPVPEAPKLVPREPSGVVTQAGVGGTVAFARAGVVELGGSLGFITSDDLTALSIAPSAGYFITDNLQISGILNWTHSKPKGTDASDVATVLVEPSFHLPITNEQFVFFGLGVGGLFQTDVDAGAAIAPRVGFKNLVGRSGMLTVDVQGIYGLNDSNVQTNQGTVLTVKSAYKIGVGYTVLL